MEPTLAAAKAGVTTGEWAAALRETFGEYRAPTGVADAAPAPGDEALSELRWTMSGRVFLPRRSR